MKLSRFCLAIYAGMAVCSGAALLPAQAAPPSPGATVIVVRDDVQFGIRDQPLITCHTGTQIRVTEVRGHWVGGYIEIAGQKHLGWVRDSDVASRDARPGVPAAAPVDAVRKPAGPEVPAPSASATLGKDDARAVAALRALGVALRLDDEDRVRQVIVEGGTVRDEDLAHLKGLPSLLQLDLSGQPITDAGLVHIGRCAELQNLYLGGTKVTNDGLPALRGLARLEVLALPGTAVTGEGLAHLKDLPGLRVLNVRRCAISDDDLRNLGPLVQLEVLALAETQISDAGLVHMRPLAKLRVLNLDHTRVTGTGFDNLVGLTELRMLYVRECQVEPDRIDKLDGELPGLAIYD
jgi:hypothetical protein